MTIVVDKFTIKYKRAVIGFMVTGIDDAWMIEIGIQREGKHLSEVNGFLIVIKCYMISSFFICC